MGHHDRDLGARWALPAALFLAVGGCGGNTDSPGPATPTSPEAEAEPEPERSEAGGAEERPAEDEEAFALALLHAAYEGETELAELASERAQSERVRAHADDLIEDYERLQPELTDTAEEVEVDLEASEGIIAHVSRELGAVYSEQRETLEQTSDEEIDRAYLSSLAATHRATLAELERIQPRLEDPEVRELVESHLPIVRRHLERAREVAESEEIELHG